MALHCNLAALCVPFVLNLLEHNEKEQDLQVEAARWLKLNREWVLIIDNVVRDEAAKETKALLAKPAVGQFKVLDLLSARLILRSAESGPSVLEKTPERRSISSMQYEYHPYPAR